MMQTFPPHLNNVSTLPSETWNAHCARATYYCYQLLPKETPEFILLQLWSPNSLDLNTVDNSMWEILQEKVNKTLITDLELPMNACFVLFLVLNHPHRWVLVAVTNSILLCSSPSATIWLPFRLVHAKMSIRAVAGRPVRLVPGTRPGVMMLSVVHLSLRITCLRSIGACELRLGAKHDPHFPVGFLCRL